MFGRRAAPVRSATSAVTGLLLTSVALSRLGFSRAFSAGPAGFRQVFSSPKHPAAHVSPALRKAPTAPSLLASNLGNSRLAGRHYSATMAAASGVRSGYDEEQLRLLDSDECIIVNEKDEARHPPRCVCPHETCSVFLCERCFHVHQDAVALPGVRDKGVRTRIPGAGMRGHTEIRMPK